MFFKEKILIAAIILSAGFFVVPKISSAQVIINEIAWMGTSISANDEWLELFNSSDQEIDITNWVLKSDDDTPKIILSGKIAAQGYFLLERTDDQSVPQIIANQIYNGGLGNNGENLKLTDSENVLIDQADCAANGWFAGDNTTKQTMEKTTDLSWQSSQNPGGTPKLVNSSGAPAPTPTPTPSATPSSSPAPSPTFSPTPFVSPTPTPAPAPSFQYSEDIFLNEFLPNPGKDEKEWAELYNAGMETINLNGWQIDDEKNSTSPLTIPDNTEIKPNEFLVIAMTKSMFNNDGDKVRLLWPDDQVIHSISYQTAKQGQTCARFETQWLWTEQPTPGQTNKKSSIESKAATVAVSSPPPQISAKEEIATEIQSLPKNSAKNIAPANQNSGTSKTDKENPRVFASQFSASKNNDGQPKETNQSLKIILTLSGIIVLAALAGGGLVFFRRQKLTDKK